MSFYRVYVLSAIQKLVRLRRWEHYEEWKNNKQIHFSVKELPLSFYQRGPSASTKYLCTTQFVGFEQSSSCKLGKTAKQSLQCSSECFIKQWPHTDFMLCRTVNLSVWQQDLLCAGNTLFRQQGLVQTQPSRLGTPGLRPSRSCGGNDTDYLTIWGWQKPVVSVNVRKLLFV